jgi:hypothetical protein
VEEKPTFVVLCYWCWWCRAADVVAEQAKLIEGSSLGRRRALT